MIYVTMLTLHIEPADGEPFEYVLESGSMVIGRSSRCDLTISDSSMSRQHLRLFEEDGVWMVEDLGSRNGTRLNGVLITGPTVVRTDDVLSASASILTVLSGLDEAALEAGVEGGRSFFRAATDILAESDRQIAAAASHESDGLRRAATQLQVLNDVHHAMAEAVSNEELFEQVLDRVFVHLQPQHGAVFLTDGERLVRAASRSAPGLSDDLPESSHLVEEVVNKGMAAVARDTLTDRRFAGAKSLIGCDVRTLVAAPLLTPDGALGMIVLGSASSERRFTKADMELLAVVASATGLKMRNLALTEEAAERRRFEAEVAVARRVQVALLPAAMPEVEGVEIYGGNTPSRGVSGDYYQVIERADDDELALVVADVSGKGIAASLLTGYVDALLTAYLGEGFAPAEVFDRVSPQMNRKTPVEAFATAFLGLYSVPTGVLRYASAGHDPSILVRSSGEIEFLKPTGLPLGLLPDARYGSLEVDIRPGDTLVLYTDGITEVVNADHQEFGRQRLAELCRDHRQQSPEELARSIEAAIDAFAGGAPIHDDQTLVILRRTR